MVLVLQVNFIFSQTDATEQSVPEPESSHKFSATVDIVYPYLWRGLKYYGNKIAFQPSLAYDVTDKINVGVWATTNFSNAADAYNEFDWSITYQFSPVMGISLSDYYWPSTKNNVDWEKSPYFDYSEGSSQTLDLSLLVDFSEKGIPLDFQWSTLIGGNDYRYEENRQPKRAFSSYAEIGYTYSVDKYELDFRPFVGAAIVNGGYYGTDAKGDAGFTFSNVGLNIAKVIKITDTSNLPTFIRYTYNDYGIQQFDTNDEVTKTVRNFISAGISLDLM